MVYSNDLFLFDHFWYFIFFSNNLTISLGISHLLLYSYSNYFISPSSSTSISKEILYLLLPFAVGALPIQDHFYFLFEGSWLHSEYNFVFQTSMRIDSWLKFSEKASPILPTEVKLHCLGADFSLATFLLSVYQC